jgi:beta-lactamase class A
MGIAKTSITAILLGAAMAVAQAQAAPALSDDPALLAQLQPILAAHHGKVALYAVQLNTGKAVGIDQNLPVQTASDIKLAILYEAMLEIREGKAHWDEKLVLKPGDPVPGSGVLTFFDTPLTLTLKDALTMMVIVSDNTATNLMIDRFGTDTVNARMASLGLVNTHLYKKIMKPATGPMPADQPKFGLGKTTPYEMATLMARIGRCELHADAPRTAPVPPTSSEGFAKPDAQDLAVCAVGLKMLSNQFYRETIPRYLETVDSSETGTAIASKTGSLNAVRNDVAIVAGKSGPMVLAIFTYDNADHGWTVDNEGEVTIAKLAKEIVTDWSPSGIDGKTLVPGLGLDVK